ncbi:cyclophilin-like fold protein [Gilvimarinus algae]|uniref:Cyclophilin-like fold protein n=1 Tax=Gilvimarinus algae TaxID=3058037 RepID=A0ABT8TGB2_9GAMM|nr:cyclophilin-like fold protein [Gilvimarinus sp. SDUM040014]MDO3382433.1 cyclophilin-like fold protein [Gilvimarinus sp. SDUM040014]
MKVSVMTGDHQWTITLIDSPTARDFFNRLPIALTLEDFAGKEKIAKLPEPLTLAEAPAGTTAQAGDLAYYAPWGNLAIFYQNSGYARGLIPLGHFEQDLAPLLNAGSAIIEIKMISK